jgi:hypothetical protein
MKVLAKYAVCWCFLLAAVSMLSAADNPKALIGIWSGKATGPQGGPPTGDITVTFTSSGRELKGTIQVKAPGGAQYSGDISKISLKQGILGATASFKLGESPLLAEVSGPLKGRLIAGTFAVTVKGQKMGDGTFEITKQPAAGSKSK